MIERCCLGRYRVDGRYIDGVAGCVLVGVPGGGGGEGVLLGAQQAGAGGQSSAEEEGGGIMNGCCCWSNVTC